MTDTKPLAVNRAQLLRDAERHEQIAFDLRDWASVHGDIVRMEDAAFHERAAQVLRAVAEGVQSVDHYGSDSKLSGYTGCDGDVVPVLIIPATISPDEGEEVT